MTNTQQKLLSALPLVILIGAPACAALDGDVATTMTDDEISVAAHARVCTSTDEVNCHARVIIGRDGQPQPNATPAGLGPTQLRDAYKITGTGTSSTTIAIVDAYDYPNAESDLAVYRAQFGLPACTTANGCFKKVNQNGVQGSYPRVDVGWAQEMALDLDMASAMCPSCKIVLVEGNGATFADLATAVDTAVNLGAHVVSNSYGASESSSLATYDSHYTHAGVAITVSSGDAGYGVEYPASSPHVTAVGGTSLKAAANTRGWTETVWNGAGSGCSTVFAKPSWQTDAGCSKRTVADVSAVADPNTGVAVYGPVNRSSAGWLVFGGTSVAAPLVGGIYAVNGGAVNYGADPYSHTSALFDVTSGSNGSCSGSYLCTASAGYDGPTGLGSPNGTGAF
jgi:subtilase family serine protease